jgi:mismatch-specific thymine-DNA glycosylase
MARKDSTIRKPKATGSANVEPDSTPKNSAAPGQAGSSTGRDVGLKLPSALKDDATTAKQHVDLNESDPLPPLLALGQSKRKRTTGKSVSESSSSKKPRPKGYAPPSTYAHLKGLTDTITPNLICLLVGLNPGIQTATMGHPYAHPSNHFWRLLHSSGLTPNRQLAPSEYVILPKEYSLGNTNIVDRATRNGAELSKEEMVEGAGVLDEKIWKAKPEVVCFVGKSIWEAVWKWKYGRKMNASEFKYGFQDTKENVGKSETDAAWPGTRVFVATSTSALAATMSMQQKQEIWRQLGEWVEKRREERKSVEDGGDKPGNTSTAAVK